MKTRILLIAAIASPVLTLQAIVDTNENGLSDLWEKQHNNDEIFPETFDPDADPDADGWTNAQEAAAGTDPFSTAHPDGHLQPETTHFPATWGDIDNDNIPDLLTPEVIQVSWPTIPGKQYTLQSNPDLTPDNWIEVDAPFVGTGTVVIYSFVTSAAAKTFWRVNITDIDSDGDNLSDAEETQIGSNSQLRDSDGDGLEDGDEVANLTNPTSSDTDIDGKEDGEDADPNENLITWEPTIESSYILIEVETSSQDPYPNDLNDKGEVLFDDGIWSEGNWIPKDLPAGNGADPSQVPYEINYGPWTHFNASGTLLGRSHLRFLEGPASGGDGVGAPVYLPSNQSSPSLILDTGDVWDPFPLYYRPLGVAADGSMTIRMDPLIVGTSQTIKRFDSAGAFVADITGFGGYEPIGSEGHGEMTSSGWVASNLVKTATDTAPAAYRVGIWDAANREKFLPSDAEGWAYPVGISAQSDGKVLLVAGAWTSSNYSGRVYLPDHMQNYQRVASLSDKKILLFAGDGTALTQDHQLWRNGKLIPFRELCTRYGELLDAEWNFFPLKANKNGVYLIQADGPHGEQAVMRAIPVGLSITNASSHVFLPENKEETVGAFAVANLNDQDGDGVIDNADNSVKKQGDVGEDEEDLMTLKVVGPFDGKMKIKVTSGNVRFWTSSTKETELLLENGAIKLNGNELPTTVFVEATTKSQDLRDIVLDLSHIGPNAVEYGDLDRVKATAVWAEHRSTRNVAGQGLWTLNHDKPFKKTFVDVLGDWGINMTPLSTDSSKRFHYSIGLEFELFPPGIADEPGVKFDISRDIAFREWNVKKNPQTAHDAYGQGIDDVFDPSDKSDDDEPSDDEDVTGLENRVYVLDGPGHQVDFKLSDEIVSRNNFKEWVRVKFDGIRPDGNNSLGSRCSNKFEWHAQYHVEWNASSAKYQQKTNAPNSVGANHINLGTAPNP